MQPVHVLVKILYNPESLLSMGMSIDNALW